MVHASSVTVEEMRPKLLTLDAARERLATTEPLGSLEFDNTSDVKFRLMPGWNHGAESRKGTDVIDASVSVNGTEVPLTQDALYEAMSRIRLSKGIGTDTPPEFIEPLLNYWFRSGFGDNKAHKIMTVNGVGGAIVRASVKPYSNLLLMDKIIEGIQAKYGDGEILVDYKLDHSVENTHLRFVIPEYVRNIENSGTADDSWSIGIDFRNSLIGKGQTAIKGYQFRWWCTNGSIDVANEIEPWSRRGQAGQSDEVYEWARQAVDDVLGGLEGSLDSIQAMTDMTLTGHTVDVLDDYFEKYKIPKPLRDTITDTLVDESTLTMYSLMQAFTQTANDSNMDPEQAARLMYIGGDIAASSDNRCGACQRGFRH